MAELKPCPFCGSHARLYKIHKIGDAYGYFVYCTFCGNRTQQGDNEIDIIAKWNRRSQ